MADPELVARWLHLTRTVLPGMAAAARWPIRLDHCFMRVFLDHAAGARWDTLFGRPAIRHAPPDVLARAVAAAERVVRHPETLSALNRESLRMRGKGRQSTTPARLGAGVVL